MMILTIVGARPQFIKAATISRAIRETDGLSEVMVHTGQHYDANMSGEILRDLGLPVTDVSAVTGFPICVSAASSSLRASCVNSWIVTFTSPTSGSEGKK